MTHGSIHLLDDADTVAVALRDLAIGTPLPGGGYVSDEIPRGHKVAVREMPSGAQVLKYGHVIGETTRAVQVGAHVHTHNLRFAPHRTADISGASTHRNDLEIELPARRTFLGYRRSDGTVGTRNYIGVLSSVNCSATAVTAIAAQVERLGILDGVEGVDGVVPLTHDTGCGLSPDGAGMEILRRTLAGYAQHPNIAGLLIIGLGCEVLQIDLLTSGLDLRPGLPVERMTLQSLGGTRATIAHALECIERMIPEVSAARREEVPVSELVLGLNCGGSDGWSGVSANPALGYASDLIVAQGGRSVLAETPEIYGAEDLLVSRAVSPAVAGELLDVIAWWEAYTSGNSEAMDNNPSPGNHAGGITTILEKSLGAVAKSGHSPLSAVLRYAERITTPGLSFMDTPGYDPVSVTGLIAGGATAICFTTGRGSALGSRPAPTLKVSTNSDLFRRMSDDMDLDAGDVVEQGVSVEAKGLEIYEALLDMASGRRTRSEELGYGTEEFVPWHLGAVM